MEPMFLTDHDLYELTDYTNSKCQRKWLDKNGVRYLIGSDGCPKVMWDHLRQIMCLPDKASGRKKTEPDVNALRRHLGTL